MPIYEYRCENGHHFDVLQGFDDDPVETCEECGAPVQRVLHPVAVHFKGSGFYSTDYAGKGKAKAESGTEGGSADSNGSKPEPKPEGGAKEKKTDSKAGSDGD